jgi:hypothetical protein
MKIYSEEDERPEHHAKRGGYDTLETMQVGKVLVRVGDNEARHEVRE